MSSSVSDATSDDDYERDRSSRKQKKKPSRGHASKKLKTNSGNGQSSRSKNKSSSMKLLLPSKSGCNRRVDFKPQLSRLQQQTLSKIVDFLSPQPTIYVPVNLDVGTSILTARRNNKKKPISGLRPIIIDGSNVAMSHGKGQKYSVHGIVICIEYFMKRGHTQVLAFLPLFRRREAPNVLTDLERRGLVVFTPSRYLDTGELLVSYDDRFIVQTAVDMGGVIVSKDNYRDLIAERPDWAKTIRERLLMFVWVGDSFLVPIDPLGPKGPNLDQFLHF